MDISMLLIKAQALTTFANRRDWLLRGEQAFAASRQYAVAELYMATKLELQRADEAKALGAMAVSLNNDIEQCKATQKTLRLDVPEVKAIWEQVLSELTERRAQYDERTVKNNALRTKIRISMQAHPTVRGVRVFPGVKAKGLADDVQQWVHCEENVSRRAAIKARLQDELKARAKCMWQAERELDELGRMVNVCQEIWDKWLRVKPLLEQVAKDEAIAKARHEWALKMLAAKHAKKQAALAAKAAEDAELARMLAEEEALKQIEAQKKAAEEKQEQINHLMSLFGDLNTEKEVAELSDELVKMGADQYEVEDLASTSYMRIRLTKRQQQPVVEHIVDVRPHVSNGLHIDSLEDLDAVATPMILDARQMQRIERRKQQSQSKVRNQKYAD